MLGTYLKILEESLEKKIDALNSIAEINQVQTQVLQKENFDAEAFDKLVDEKDIYIKQLTQLDDGFESLYDKIKEELVQNKSKYTEQIKHLQCLIAEITDKSLSIQAQENRNKALVEKHFTKEKNEIGRVRRSSKAAYGYYQNMSKKNVSESHFMDQKK